VGSISPGAAISAQTQGMEILLYALRVVSAQFGASPARAQITYTPTCGEIGDAALW
jgi:hypothetical protein